VIDTSREFTEDFLWKNDLLYLRCYGRSIILVLEEEEEALCLWRLIHKTDIYLCYPRTFINLEETILKPLLMLLPDGQNEQISFTRLYVPGGRALVEIQG
jgi:hypothetical protein